jgi:hypothetical protein
MWVIKKRRESQSKERFSGDFGHVARQISDPIYDPQHAARTDFMRRGSRSAQPSPNSASGLVYNDKSDHQPVHGLTPRIKSMWDRTPKLNFGFSSGLPSNHPPSVPAIAKIHTPRLDTHHVVSISRIEAAGPTIDQSRPGQAPQRQSTCSCLRRVFSNHQKHMACARIDSRQTLPIQPSRS